MDPFTPEQVDYLAKYLAKEFISRTDIKAEQMPFHKGSAYRPIHKPWKMGDLRAHVRGESTFGHYLLDQDSMVKFIAFDIDLEKTGTYCDYSDKNVEEFIEAVNLHGVEFDEYFQFYELNTPDELRNAWLNRKHPGRPWFKYQMRSLADAFENSMHNLGMKTLCTYSGSKGIHAYGLFGERVPAEAAREVAFQVLEDAAKHVNPASGEYEFVASKGKNFYRLSPKNPDVQLFDRYDNFSVEIFPKQSHIEPLRLGNLMRLDFGKNLKAPKEPTFVIDQTRSAKTLAPHDTFDELRAVLESGNPRVTLEESGKNDK